MGLGYGDSKGGTCDTSVERYLLAGGGGGRGGVYEGSGLSSWPVVAVPRG